MRVARWSWLLGRTTASALPNVAGAGVWASSGLPARRIWAALFALSNRLSLLDSDFLAARKKRRLTIYFIQPDGLFNLFHGWGLRHHYGRGLRLQRRV